MSLKDTLIRGRSQWGSGLGDFGLSVESSGIVLGVLDCGGTGVEKSGLVWGSDVVGDCVSSLGKVIGFGSSGSRGMMCVVFA